MIISPKESWRDGTSESNHRLWLNAKLPSLGPPQHIPIRSVSEILDEVEHQLIAPEGRPNRFSSQ